MSNKHNTDLSAVSVIVCLRGGNHFWNNSQNNILKSFMFADQIQNWSEFRDHCLILCFIVDTMCALFNKQVYEAALTRC